MSEYDESEVWLTKKFGKLHLYNIETQQILAENNSAHMLKEGRTFDINSV